MDLVQPTRAFEEKETIKQCYDTSKIRYKTNCGPERFQNLRQIKTLGKARCSGSNSGLKKESGENLDLKNGNINASEEEPKKTFAYHSESSNEGQRSGRSSFTAHMSAFTLLRNKSTRGCAQPDNLRIRTNLEV